MHKTVHFLNYNAHSGIMCIKTKLKFIKLQEVFNVPTERTFDSPFFFHFERGKWKLSQNEKAKLPVLRNVLSVPTFAFLLFWQ